jgi:small GTP-binding protein
MSIISKKICLIGDFSVGKTSLIKRFIEDKFSDRYLTTVGVKISRKTVTIDTSTTSAQQVNLLVWDIEGHTKQKSISLNYLQGAHGAIVVGDLTRTDTLKQLANHLELFLEVNPQSKSIVAFNKSDLITTDKLNKLVERHSFANYNRVISSYVTSAKTGDSVNYMFEQLAINLIN